MNIDNGPDVEVIFTLLSTEEGGRSNPVTSGYCPHHLVMPNYLTSGKHHYLGKDSIRPGESVCAYIDFITPEVYPKTIWVGRSLQIQEGEILVGHAIVTKVFNKILQGDSSKPIPIWDGSKRNYD